MSDNEDHAYQRLMSDLKAEASDAGMGYGAETEYKRSKRRSKKKSKKKGKGGIWSWVIPSLLIFVVAIEYWYITVAIIIGTIAIRVWRRLK